VLLAPVVLVVLTDRPAVATWLADDERAWLEGQLESERRAIEGKRKQTLFEALTDRRVVGLSMIYLTIVTATYGITFFLPLIVKGHGLTDVSTGLATAIPYTIGTIGMVLWAYSSDRQRERRGHFFVASVVAGIGLIAAGLSTGLVAALAAMSVATIGLYGSKPAFWPLPSTFLSGTAAAGGIAMVNSIGNLGGFLGPYIVGWIKDSTQSYASGLYFLAACAFASGVIALLVVKPAEPVRLPQAAPLRSASL
jgi:ACS family tartrate transporter-like MFS transporter